MINCRRCENCSHVGSIHVTSNILQLPKYLNIMCKRVTQDMKGAIKRSTRPVVLLRYYIASHACV